MNSFISFFQGILTTDLGTPHYKKWGLLWLLLLNTGKYWLHKNHSVFLTNITNLLNTLCKRIMYTYLLHFLLFSKILSLKKVPSAFVTFSRNTLKFISKITLLFDFPRGQLSGHPLILQQFNIFYILAKSIINKQSVCFLLTSALLQFHASILLNGKTCCPGAGAFVF